MRPSSVRPWAAAVAVAVFVPASIAEASPVGVGFRPAVSAAQARSRVSLAFGRSPRALRQANAGLRFAGYPYGYGFGSGRCLYGVCESAAGHRGSGYGFGGYGLGSAYGYGYGGYGSAGYGPVRSGTSDEVALRPRTAPIVPVALGIREAPSLPAAFYMVGEKKPGSRAGARPTSP
jgi:hypothetical protein